MPRLRLVKVVVQPFLVVDDGDNLTERPARPITVAAADWPTFSAQLIADIAALQSTVNAEDEQSAEDA